MLPLIPLVFRLPIKLIVQREAFLGPQCISAVMFRTKKDVDKHVQDIHSKIKPSERNLKGYSIAKLYYGVSVLLAICISVTLHD